MDPHTRWKPPPPPPSYDSVLDTDRTPSSPLLPQRSEQQPLLPQSGLDALREGRKPRYSRELRGVLYIIGIVLLGVLVAQNAGLLRCSLDDALPEEKAALRAQWQRELAQHQAHLVSWAREHDKHQRAHDRFVAEEARWRRAREAFRHEQQEWQVAWEQEARHRAELERKRLGLQWAEPWGDGYCARYGAREYHATLRGVPDGREWLELCESMPVTIHGQVLDRPDRCEHNDRGEVLGHWVISDELDCMPHWGDVDDLGCVETDSGMKRYEARLWNVRGGSDWNHMCATKPATINGVHFDRPTHCDDRGHRGMIGIFHVPNRWCDILSHKAAQPA